MTPRSASTRSLAAASFAARIVARALIDDSNLDPHGKCDRAVPRPKLHPWKALHACNTYESVGAIVDAQSSSGMFPEVVTPSRAPRVPTERSLVGSWRSVRRWRRTLRECPTAAGCELVHAHCFAAGMAAVRAFPTVVYELEQFLEDESGHPAWGERPHSARILKSAEWFTLSRSAAIVVRTQSVRRELLRRGAAAEHVFVIPHPLPTAETESPRILPLRKYESGDDAFTIFSTLNVGTGWQGWLRQLLAAAQSASLKLPNLALHLEVDQLLQREAWRLLTSFGCGIQVRLLDGLAAAHALSRCSLVVAGAARRPGTTPVENALALAALRASKPLLAADLDCNRDVSANGSGCIWFAPGDAADLSRRMVFLASDAAFRYALVASGARYLRETRAAARIAEQYDAVYWHALVRRRSGKWQTPTVIWQPSHAFI